MNLKKRRNIVARVMAAENKSEAVIAEAKRAGVSTRTVERWVEALSKAAPSVGQPDVSPNVPPEPNPAENPVLDKLLGVDGTGGKVPEGPPTKTEVDQAAADAAQFCVEAYAGIRSATGAVLVQFRYTPPLDASSPEVLKLLQVGQLAEMAIRANAPKLYPILVRYASGWGPLAVAVAVDALGMFVGLEALAKGRGWTHQPKKATDRPTPQTVPPSQAYGDQLRTPQSVPADASPEEKARATIVDAPPPTPEQIEAANTMRSVLVG